MTKSVFISSTSKDLQAHRAIVKQAIERLDLHAIDMVNFGSQPGDAVEVSLAEVAKADILVGIIAHHYGYVPEGDTKSVTEQEFDEALRLKMPCLMYLVDPAHDWPDEFIESDEIAQQRLNAFKVRINTMFVRSLFTTPENLTQQVTSDLAKERQKLLNFDKRRNRFLVMAALGILILLSVIIAILVITAPDEEIAGIAQADRMATNEAIAAENQTATASRWTPTPSPTPQPMPSGFNVIVAGFGEKQPSGDIAQSDVADTVSDILLDAMNELMESGFVGNLRNRHSNGVGYILDQSSEARRLRAEDIAKSLNADVVIYGTVTVEGFWVDVQPEFYFAEGFTTFEPEFATLTKLSENYRYLMGDDFDSEMDGAMQSQLLVINYFVKGLRYQILGDFDDAVDAFLSAIDNIEGQASRSLYIVAGNAANRVADDEDAAERALELYTQALDVDPQYSRGLAGRGGALFALARLSYALNRRGYPLDESVQCTDEYRPTGYIPLLQLAEQCVLEAMQTPNKPEFGDVDVRMNTQMAQILAFISARDLDDRWGEVVAFSTKVIEIYDNYDEAGQGRTHYYTGYAHQLIGEYLWTQYLETFDPDYLMQASDEIDTAIALFQLDVNLEYNQTYLDILKEKQRTIQDEIQLIESSSTDSAR